MAGSHDKVPFVPNELICHILSFVTGSDNIAAVMSTCRRFYDLALPFKYCSVLLDFTDPQRSMEAQIDSHLNDAIRPSRNYYLNFLRSDKSPKWKRVRELSIVLDNPLVRIDLGDDLISPLLKSMHDLEILTLDTPTNMDNRQQHVPFIDTFHNVWPKARLQLRLEFVGTGRRRCPDCTGHNTNLRKLDTCPSLTHLSVLNTASAGQLQRLSPPPPLTRLHLQDFPSRPARYWESSRVWRWITDGKWLNLEGLTLETDGHGRIISDVLGGFAGRTPKLREFSCGVLKKKSIPPKATAAVINFLGQSSSISKLTLRGFDQKAVHQGIMSVATGLMTLRFSGKVDEASSREVFASSSNLQHFAIITDHWNSFMGRTSTKLNPNLICDPWLNTYAESLPPSLQHLELWVSHPAMDRRRTPITIDNQWNPAAFKKLIKDRGGHDGGLRILDLQWVRESVETEKEEWAKVKQCTTFRAHVGDPSASIGFQELDTTGGDLKLGWKEWNVNWSGNLSSAEGKF